MSAIQDRLAMFLTELNISQQKFERQCDMGQGGASKLTSKSYATTFAKISRAYPQLNIGWLKTGEGQMLKPEAASPINVRQDHNPNSALYGYVYIAVPEKGKKKILNSEGVVIEGDDAVSEQLEHYKAIIAAKDEQISRLMAMIEEKDKTIARLIEKL